jgi:hypothetical protein
VSESGRKTQDEMMTRIRAFQQALKQESSEDKSLVEIESSLSSEEKRQRVLDTIDSVSNPPLSQLFEDLSLPSTLKEISDAYLKIVGEKGASRRDYYTDLVAIDKLTSEGMSLDDAIEEVTKPLVLKR